MRRIGVTTIALAVLASPGIAQEMNTLSHAEREAGWKLLFDGESLDGWRGRRLGLEAMQCLADRGGVGLTGIDVMPEEQEDSWISRTWNAVF